MSFFDDDVTAPEPRPPRPRRKRNKRALRLQRLAIFIVALFAVVFVLALTVRYCQKQARETAYRTYFTSVQNVVNDSSSVGKDLGAILANPTKYDRRTLTAKLDDLVNRQNEIADRAQAIKPPGKLSQLHAVFVQGMRVRQQGVKLTRDGLLAALGKKNAAATAKKLSELSGYFAGPDVYYKELFYTQAQKAMAGDGVTNVAVPVSDYFIKNDIFDRAALETALKRMTTSGNLSGIHGVSLVSVVAEPSGTKLKAGKDTNVKSDPALKFAVTVENQGTVTESNVPIELTFTPAGSSAQKLTATIDALGPSEKATVQIAVSIPGTAISKTSQLKVMVGPVKGEKMTGNNGATYGVILQYQ